MGTLNLIALLAVAGVFVYLVIALFFPEKFS